MLTILQSSSESANMDGPVTPTESSKLSDAQHDQQVRVLHFFLQSLFQSVYTITATPDCTSSSLLQINSWVGGFHKRIFNDVVVISMLRAYLRLKKIWSSGLPRQVLAKFPLPFVQIKSVFLRK